MDKTLYLLCPTDYLEPVINATFNQESFFYTSLGNSLSLDVKTLESIKEILVKHYIKEIYFVISDDNKIVSDALGRQSFSKIKGLQEFYDEVLKQKEHSDALWQTQNSQFSIISYYLNKRIKELQFQLDDFKSYSIKIGGKIYQRDEGVFRTIHSDLICLEKHFLN